LEIHRQAFKRGRTHRIRSDHALSDC
jgi:hypothetical protein